MRSLVVFFVACGGSVPLERPNPPPAAPDYHAMERALGLDDAAVPAPAASGSGAEAPVAPEGSAPPVETDAPVEALPAEGQPPTDVPAPPVEGQPSATP